MTRARVMEAGLFALGGLGLAAAKFGVPEPVAALFADEEPQAYMSSANPWSKSYDPQSVPPAVYYPNCDAARAAGAAPMRIGTPGYRANLDADGDGIACEPYRGR